MILIEPRFGFRLDGALDAAWRRLQGEAASPTFQHDPEHVAAWLRHLGEGYTPLLLVAREGTGIAGIVPLMFLDGRRRGLLPYRSVRFLADLHADYAAVLASPERAGEVLAATFAWLFEAEWRWEALVLDNLRGEDPADAARAWLEEKGVPHALAGGLYYHVDLARPWEDVMADTSHRFVRKNVNLARNRLGRAGGYEVEASTAWEAGRVLAEAAPIHAARQQQMGRASLLSDPRGLAFLDAIIRHHTARGRFRAYWLRSRGRTIAYMLGFEDRGVYHAWNMAFDPEAAAFYPSRLLIHEILRDCHARGLGEFDFMRGEADYKSKWTAAARPRTKLVVKNRTTTYGRAVHFLESVFVKPREVAAR
ncbi:MAG TPA: GNAT family N-acetyltransferase [Planctomycetota bacterium]|nr:GNAT family N-acetyltransferase [Planctomycetota bacterium]